MTLGVALLFVGVACMMVGHPRAQMTLTGVGPGGAATSAGCTPPPLTNLVGNWRADTGVSAPGGNIASVANQASGGSFPFLSVGGLGSVPFTSSSTYHSKPAFGFTVASAAALSATGFPIDGTSSFSVFAVGRLNTAAGGNAGLLTYGGPGSLNNDFNGAGNAVVIASDGTPNGIVYQSNTSGAANTTMSLDTNHGFGYTVDFSGLTITGYIDGVVVSTSTPVTSTLDTNGTLVFGNRFLGGVAVGTNGWEGPILQLIIQNAVSTPTEIAGIEAYRICEYGAFVLERDMGLHGAANDNAPLWLSKVA